MIIFRNENDDQAVFYATIAEPNRLLSFDKMMVLKFFELFLCELNQQKIK